MLKILVVEDDKNTRKLMNAILKANGYFPIMACDGQEALDVLERQYIDLMICTPYWMMCSAHLQGFGSD